MNNIENPWIELVELDGVAETNVAEMDNTWLSSLSKSSNLSRNVSAELRLNLFPEPYIGNPKAQIYLLNGNPGFHDNDVPFVEKDKYFQDAIKKTLTHQYRNKSCGDFLYLDEELKDKKFNIGTITHPGYKWWTDHLGKLNEIIKPCPKVFNIEFFPYHSKNLKNLKKYFDTKMKESGLNCSDWPDWPSFEYTKNLVIKAINKRKLIVVMRLKKYWYSAIPGLRNYYNVIELKDSQTANITEENVQFRVGAEALCKATWGVLLDNA